jgi:hypothetical protein
VVCVPLYAPVVFKQVFAHRRPSSGDPTSAFTSEPGEGSDDRRPGSTPQQGSVSRRWWTSAYVIAVGIVWLSVLLGAPTRNNFVFSPYDEAAHYDYVVQLSHGHIPHWGSRYSQPTIRVVSCMPFFWEGPYPVKLFHGAEGGCGVVKRNPELVPPIGFNYEAQQPPLAYLPYVVVANPGAPPRQAIADVRRGGTIWVAIGAALLVVLGAIEGLTLLEMTAVLAICILNPLTVYNASTVDPYSSGIAAGALILLTAAWARRRKRAMVSTGLLIGIVVGQLNGLFLFAPLALVIAEIIRERRRSGRLRWRELWLQSACVICMLFGTLVSYAGWIVFQSARASVPQSVVMHHLLGGAPTMRPQWSTMFTSFMAVFNLLGGNTPLDFLWQLATLGIIVGVVFAQSQGAHIDSWLRPAAFGVTISLTALAISFPIYAYFLGHFNLPAYARYALAVVPIGALVAVRASRRSGLIVIGLVFPGVVAASQLLPGHL